MPPMDARALPDFQRPPFLSQVSQKSNLEAMIESMPMAQQKQVEYIEKLASKIDVLTTHDKMLKAQISQPAGFPYTTSDRLSSKPDPNSREHCNYVNLKEEVEDFTNPEDIPIKVVEN